MDRRRRPAGRRSGGRGVTRRTLLAAALALAVLAGAALLLLEDSAEPGGDPEPGGGSSGDGGGPVADATASVERSGPLSDRVRLGYPAPGDTVAPPLPVVGEAPGGWYFEAVFSLRLLDPGGAGLADSFATAQGEWMVEGPVAFRGALRPAGAIPRGGAGATLVLARANASGLPEHDAEVRVPLRLAGAGAPRLYFPNAVLDPDAADCRRVRPVARPATAGEGADPGAAARALLDALLAGPTARERAGGYHTALPDRVAVLSVTLDEGALRVDFDRGMAEGVAGSCRVRAIRAQLDSTLLRLPGVERVVVAVEGDVEGALQP